MVSHEASLSMEFSRQEYWRGLPFPAPGDLPGPGIEPGSPALQADSFLLIHPEIIKSIVIEVPRTAGLGLRLRHPRI